MNSKQRVQAALAGNKTDRPLFCPAVYEHKARLVAKSPGQVCRNALLLEQAVLAEYETYAPDMLTVGIDVYKLATSVGWDVYPIGSDCVPQDIPKGSLMGLVLVY